MISMLVGRVARAEASAQRIEETLANAPDVAAPAEGLVFAPQGRLAFEDVSFGYRSEARDVRLEASAASRPLRAADQTEPQASSLKPQAAGDLVLKGISFAAEPGETVAVLGATGAGKSSLVNLIPRFYDVTGGRITLDGVDIREIDERALRGSVAVALQESILFSGTIRDNIRYGRPAASDDDVVAAARMAQAHEFISGFPDGYDSMVGQRGVNLSGGQKQRLAIARALLTQPAVLVLDDSTSAVDMATEARLQAALAELPRRPTRVVVAQRISTVLGADTILVLDDGRVAARGPHAELLASSPIYREIYESQVEQVAHD
jgi:ATP-binding cassette subfamily B protein